MKAVSIVNEDRICCNRLWLDRYAFVAGNDDLDSYVSRYGMERDPVLKRYLLFVFLLQSDKSQNRTNERTDNHIAAFIFVD